MTPRHLVSYWRRSRAVSDDRHRSSSLRCTKAQSSIQDEYGPLAHAPSALSVGGGSFANNMPSGSINNAVSSFQQLLETLTPYLTCSACCRVQRGTTARFLTVCCFSMTVARINRTPARARMKLLHSSHLSSNACTLDGGTAFQARGTPPR